MDSVDGFCLHLKIRLRQLSDFELPNTLETIKKVFLMAAEDSWKPTKVQKMMSDLPAVEFVKSFTHQQD